MRVNFLWNLDLFGQKMAKHVTSKKVRKLFFHSYLFFNEGSIDKP